MINKIYSKQQKTWIFITYIADSYLIVNIEQEGSYTSKLLLNKI